MGKQWNRQVGRGAWRGLALVASISSSWAQGLPGAQAADAVAVNGMVASGAGAGALARPALPVPPPASVDTAPQALVLHLDDGPRARSRGLAPRWTSETRLRDDTLPAVSIVTLPPDVMPGRTPGRAHHALSVRSETPRQALRSLGLDVTECATRFRLPTRLRQDSPGGDTTLDAQAQVSWACRF